MEIQFLVPRKGRVRVVKGEISETFTPETKEYKRIGELVGLSPKDVAEACNRFIGNPTLIVKIEVDDPVPPDFIIKRRNINSSEGVIFKDKDTITCLRKAIVLYEENTILQWEDPEKLAVLDIDYHGHQYTPELGGRVERGIGQLRPRPICYAKSRSGGYHGYFVENDKFTAQELAAVAGIHWLNLDRTATFDLVKQVRVPKDVIWNIGTNDSGTVSVDWLHGDVSEDSIEEWRDERGFVVGTSYPHEQCPIAPGSSHGVPVLVDEWGIYCHKCYASGVCYGSRKPGVFPYATLLRGDLPNVVSNMSRNFTHWEHARIVLRELFGLRDSTLKLAYSACLKQLHHDDPRISKVFTSGHDIIRSGSRWTTRNCLGDYTKRVDGILATLPSCQSAKGELLNDKLVRYLQNIDLREWGYPDVMPVRGLKIYGHNLPPKNPDNYYVVVPSQKLATPAYAKFLPKYKDEKSRMPEDEAWHIIEGIFPGINRNYLQLLIAAKGVSEGEVGLPPLVLVTGPTSAGKTVTVNLAAAMTGDFNTEIVWNESVERFRQSLKGGIDAGSYITVNEILKDANRSGSTALEAMDVFLNVTPNSVSHVMYIGPVALGRIPVCICTETAVPQKLRDDRQLARRFIYLQLDEEHQEWQQLNVDSGLMGPENFRTFMEGRGAAASDSIVSAVIDRFFDIPRTFEDIAKDLGFTRLIDSPDFDNPEDDLRSFYHEYENSPTNDEGYRYIDRHSDTPLAEAWERLCDGNTEDTWHISRRVDECDWKKVLGKDKVLKLIKRKRKSKLLFKFQEK